MTLPTPPIRPVSQEPPPPATAPNPTPEAVGKADYGVFKKLGKQALNKLEKVWTAARTFIAGKVGHVSPTIERKFRTTSEMQEQSKIAKDLEHLEDLQQRITAAKQHPNFGELNTRYSQAIQAHRLVQEQKLAPLNQTLTSNEAALRDVQKQLAEVGSEIDILTDEYDPDKLLAAMKKRGELLGQISEYEGLIAVTRAEIAAHQKQAKADEQAIVGTFNKEAAPLRSQYTLGVLNLRREWVAKKQEIDDYRSKFSGRALENAKELKIIDKVQKSASEFFNFHAQYLAAHDDSIFKQIQQGIEKDIAILRDPSTPPEQRKAAKMAVARNLLVLEERANLAQNSGNDKLAKEISAYQQEIASDPRLDPASPKELGKQLTADYDNIKRLMSRPDSASADVQKQIQQAEQHRSKLVEALVLRTASVRYYEVAKAGTIDESVPAPAGSLRAQIASEFKHLDAAIDSVRRLLTANPNTPEGIKKNFEALAKAIEGKAQEAKSNLTPQSEQELIKDLQELYQGIKIIQKEIINFDKLADFSTPQATNLRKLEHIAAALTTAEEEGSKLALRTEGANSWLEVVPKEAGLRMREGASEHAESVVRFILSAVSRTSIDPAYTAVSKDILMGLDKSPRAQAVFSRNKTLKQMRELADVTVREDAGKTDLANLRETIRAIADVVGSAKFKGDRIKVKISTDKSVRFEVRPKADSGSSPKELKKIGLESSIAVSLILSQVQQALELDDLPTVERCVNILQALKEGAWSKGMLEGSKNKAYGELHGSLTDSAKLKLESAKEIAEQQKEVASTKSGNFWNQLTTPPGGDKFQRSFLLSYRTFIDKLVTTKNLDIDERHEKVIEKLSDSSKLFILLFNKFSASKDSPEAQKAILRMAKAWLSDPNMHNNDFKDPVTARLFRRLIEAAEKQHPQDTEIQALKRELAEAVEAKPPVDVARTERPFGDLSEQIGRVASGEIKVGTSAYDVLIADTAANLRVRSAVHFSQIRSGEFTSAEWGKHPEMSPEIIGMIADSTDLSNYVAREVARPMVKAAEAIAAAKGKDIKQLTPEDLEQEQTSRVMEETARVIEFFIDLQTRLIDRHTTSPTSPADFNSFMAIQAGLSLSSITRLKPAMGLISDDHAETRTSFATLANPEKSSKNLRAEMGSHTHAIPFLGTVLSDITFIIDGNPSIVPEGGNFAGQVNVTKIELMGERVDDIVSLQRGIDYDPAQLETVDTTIDSKFEAARAQAVDAAVKKAQDADPSTVVDLASVTKSAAGRFAADEEIRIYDLSLLFVPRIKTPPT